VDQNRPNVQSQITFLYYRDLEPAAGFYQKTMGLELVEDQGWAKIYRVSGNAFLGIVDEKRGLCKAQAKNAVVVTFAVPDVFWWYEYLRRQGIKLLTEVQESKEIQVRGFFAEDPGGYTIEIQRFLEPETARIFHS